MREIEVKARIKNKDEILENLKKIGCVFEDVRKQVDVVYVEKVGDLKTFLSNKIFLRIRESNGKFIFTLKSNGENSLTKIEHETEVISKEGIEGILETLNYVPAVTTKKTRYITHYNNFEICVDNVEGLGDFIEVETITNEGDAEPIQDEMFSFLESLGVKKEDRVFDGYDILILKKELTL